MRPSNHMGVDFGFAIGPAVVSPDAAASVKRGKKTTSVADIVVNNVSDAESCGDGKAVLAHYSSARRLAIGRAAEIAGKLPLPGEIVHIIVGRNFDVGNLLLHILETAKTPCSRLFVATLGVSRPNIEMLTRLAKSGMVRHCKLVISDLERHKRPEIVATAERAAKGGYFEIVVCRSHCKVLALTFDGGDCYCITGSANIRNCACAEQFTIVNDPETAAFYEAAIVEAGLQCLRRSPAKPRLARPRRN